MIGPRHCCLLVIAMGLVASPRSLDAAPLPPAVASSITRAIVKYFGKEGAEESAEYLGRKGSQEVLERVSAAAAKQGGEQAVDQVAILAAKYGPEALTALDHSPNLVPVIKALNQLPEGQVAVALTRLSAGKAGRELAEATGKIGVTALRTELAHPGVGLVLVRSLGEEGAELAGRLTTDQAIAVGRHADDISRLSSAQRSGVLSMLRNDADRLVAFMGRFVEANPGKTLFTAATTAVILAEPERILGGDEVVFDAEGNPIVVRKGGLTDRVIEAGGDVAGHVSANYLRPLYLTVATLAGILAIGWIGIKVWQYKKLKRLLRRPTA